MKLEIKNIVSKYLDVDINHIEEDMSLMQIVSFEIMDFCEIIYEIEEFFDIDIDDEIYSETLSINDICTYIDTNKKRDVFI